MLLKGNELAALLISSATLITLSVGITTTVVSGKKSEQKNNSATASVVVEEKNSGALRYELWDAFQVCKDIMQKEDSYRLVNTHMDAHSSHYDETSNTNEIYIDADVFPIEKGKTKTYTKTLRVICMVSAKTNEVKTFKTKVKRS